ncbi:MAG: hypothetical protein R3Y24_06065 [Eubacteriales bacterium]
MLIKKLSCVILSLCVLVMTGQPMSVNAIDNDIVMEVNGAEINVSELAKENGVDPYELLNSINTPSIDGRISPWSNVEVKYDLIMEIDGVEINITELANQNNVDPYELREAINNGYGTLYGELSVFSMLDKSGTNIATTYTVSDELSRTGMQQKYCISQDSTAYVSSAGALTASGKTPTVGMCAMHIDVTTKTGSTTENMVRLGETIYMNSAVNVNGTNYYTLKVEDRGERENATAFWIDVYFGLSSSYYQNAITYGVKPVSFHYYYYES